MRAMLNTAGERVDVTCAVPWIADVLTEGAAGQLAADDGLAAGVRVSVERGSAAFDVTGWRVLTRDAWCRPGQVVIRDACSSGLDLQVTADESALDVVARWRPSGKGRVAAALLRSRARLLLRAVLLQYPALWRSQQRGRAPLHASVCGLGGTDDRTVLLAGPCGVGKSTLVHGELLAGASCTCDNLCESDGKDRVGRPGAVGAPRRGPPGPRAADAARAPRGDLAAAHRRDAARPPGRGLARRPRRDHVRPGARGPLPGGRHLHGRGTAPLLVVRGHAGARHRPGGQSSPGRGGGGLGLSRSLPCLQVALGDHPGAPLRELLGTATEVAA